MSEVDKNDTLIKRATDAISTSTKQGFKFWTAGSKKVVIALVFLLSVAVDKMWLKDIIYGDGDLWESKVFKAIVVTVIIILTSDLKGLANKLITSFTKKISK